MQTLIESSQLGGATRDHNLLIQVLSYVNVARLDAVDHHLVNARPLETNLIRREQDLGRSVFLGSKLNHGSIREEDVLNISVVPLPLSWIHLLVVSEHLEVTVVLFELAQYLELVRLVEHVAIPPHQLLKVPRHISASDVYSLDGVVDRETLENRTAVADAITAVEHQSGCFASSVEG